MRWPRLIALVLVALTLGAATTVFTAWGWGIALSTPITVGDREYDAGPEWQVTRSWPTLGLRSRQFFHQPSVDEGRLLKKDAPVADLPVPGWAYWPEWIRNGKWNGVQVTAVGWPRPALTDTYLWADPQRSSFWLGVYKAHGPSPTQLPIRVYWPGFLTNTAIFGAGWTALVLFLLRPDPRRRASVVLGAGGVTLTLTLGGLVLLGFIWCGVWATAPAQDFRSPYTWLAGLVFAWPLVAWPLAWIVGRKSERRFAFAALPLAIPFLLLAVKHAERPTIANEFSPSTLYKIPLLFAWASAITVAAAWHGWRLGRRRRRRIDDVVRCAACGYPLRGLTRGVCPECGREIEAGSSVLSRTVPPPT